MMESVFALCLRRGPQLHNQFFSGLRMMDLIDTLKPKTILEIGFGAGANAFLMLAHSLRPDHDFRLISLSDQPKCPIPTLPDEFCKNFIYVNGISYETIPKFHSMGLPDEFNKSIDFCIIDTDHNYYTLKKELEVVDSIMSPKCAIALHDTAKVPCEHHKKFQAVTHPTSNAMFKSHGYDDGTPYPFADIMQDFDVPMMRAIDDFLAIHSDYKTIKHTEECCGCTVLARDFDYTIKNERSM